MSFFKKKNKKKTSPAACLIPQYESKLRQERMRKRRPEYVSDNASPGKLYTYVSAGNIELPGVADTKPVCERSIRPVILIAALLVFIWVLF